MRRMLRRSGVAAAVVLVAMQIVRPARTNPPGETRNGLASVHPMPAHVAAVVDRACRDCHSNETRWPWYSNVAPVSWFVIDHVNHGRSHFNYSEWHRYDAKEAERLLAKACEMARSGEMPLPSYTIVHRAARLSAADVEALCGWSEEMRRVYGPDRVYGPER